MSVTSVEELLMMSLQRREVVCSLELLRQLLSAAHQEFFNREDAHQPCIEPQNPLNRLASTVGATPAAAARAQLTMSYSPDKMRGKWERFCC